MRASRNQTYMMMAYTISLRSTCARRRTGCILTDSRGHILSSGYNGVPSSFPHCRFSETSRCSASTSDSGKDLEGCRAVHAEQNALLQCPDVYRISTCYTTTLPCIHCIKLLLNTSCNLIVYSEDYPHADAVKEMWLSAGGAFTQIAHPFDANTVPEAAFWGSS